MRRNRRRVSAFKFKPFSVKQRRLLSWWREGSPYKDYDMVLADGAIRSGKTIAMICSFLQWSMETFEGKDFIIAGRSMGALKRNVLKPMLQILSAWGIPYDYNRSENFIVIGGNTYYCFGASTEASQDVVQGLTSAGALADEVALFPQSFVDQMIGRCSVEGSKVFMNCNPAGPFHHIKMEYIDKATEKHIYHLHFTMDDNLSLSERVKERYRRMFSGVFFQRYILGLWVMAEGIIYDLFEKEQHCTEKVPKSFDYYLVGVDHGTSNPTAFGLYGVKGENILKIDEYYYDSRKHGRQKTDLEYAKDMKKFLGDIEPRYIYLDPSAASFKAQLRNDGFRQVKDANNAIVDGIRTQSSLLQSGRYKIVESKCPQTVRDYSAYVWDPRAQQRGEDKPLQENDHTKDEERYVLHTHFGGPSRKVRATRSLY